MRQTKVKALASHWQVIQLYLFGVILLMMGACTFKAPPLYQPVYQKGVHNQFGGYFDYQIDKQTYLVGHTDYRDRGFGQSLSSEAALKGAWE